MNSLCLYSNILLYIMTQIIVVLSTHNTKYNLTYFWVLLSCKILLAQLVSVQTAYFRNPKFHKYQVRVL